MNDSIDSSLLDDNGSPANTTFERAILNRSVSVHYSSRPSLERELNWNSNEAKQKENYSFWILIVALVLIAAGNLSLTFFAMGVLRLGVGMESIEILPGLKITKFYGTTDLGEIQKKDGIIQGFGDAPFSIIGDNDEVLFSLRSRKESPQMSFDPQRILFSNIEEFKVQHTSTGQDLLSTRFPDFEMPSGVRDLNVLKSQTHRIVSPTNDDLEVLSDSTIRLKGNEGMNLKSKKATWIADQDISIKTINGSVVLDGAAGIFVEVNILPLAGPEEVSRGRGQYKLCLCFPKGLLFRVPVPADNDKRAIHHQITCNSFNNPCM